MKTLSKRKIVMNAATKEAFNAIDAARYIERLRSSIVGETLRVEEKIAKKWLLLNKTVMSQGHIYYLQIKRLGLGVCEVAIAPLKIRETLVVKKICS